MLQETHLKTLDTRFLYCQGYNVIYQATNNSKKAGVAIMLENTVKFMEKGRMKDAQGRFIFVKGTIEGQMMTMGSVYAPNTGQNEFLLNMLKRLRNFMEGTVILGGDLNVVFNAQLDRSANSTSTGGVMSNEVKTLLQSEGMIDVWRTLHTTEKDYTFFSHVHRTSSRIDYFLTHGTLLKATKNCEIGPITFSDHAPVFFEFHVSGNKSYKTSWRLNELLMRDPILIEETRVLINNYFKENDNGEVSKAIVWEACKATLRGHFMTQMRKINTERKAQVEKATQDLQAKQKLYRDTGTLVALREWNRAKTRFNMLMADKVEMQLLKTKQRYYEYGDKPSRLLARRLKARIEKSFIATLKSQNGKRLQGERDKQELFRSFYEKLYTTQDTNEAEIAQYLNNNPLPTIDEQDRVFLEREIDIEEVLAVIKELKLGKSPGPDGMTGTLYKQFAAQLAPHLTALFNTFGTNGVITQSMQEAIITLIPKPGKDPEECASYRPISLLNIDAKIYTKVLANRLQSILPKLVHPDQTGFIIGRTTFDNTRKVIHLIEKAKRSKDPACLISLDAEKAFDRLEWSLMKAVLEQVGIGPKMRSRIIANYVKPMAKIRINGEYSTNFKLTRGTRQGCPLSPLLFALTLEPLANAIRNNQEIKGITIGGKQHKISLFADDIILSLTLPKTSIEETMRELDKYATISGFRINYTKSEALNLTLTKEELEEIKKASPLQWAPNSIKYLGVYLTADPLKLYEANFPPLLKTIRKDLAEWGHITKSWMGRLSIVKMNILPRLLYLFQALPIEIAQKILLMIQQLLMKYIWDNKKPRIRKQILYRPKNKGGIACPDILKYYMASQLRVLWEWSKLDTTKVWVEIEECLVKGRIGAQAWLAQTQRHGNAYIDTPLRTTFKTWDKAMRTYELSTFPSPFMPLWNNPQFTPGCDTKAFLKWEEGGCILGRDMITGKNRCKSFTQCKIDFGLGEGEKLRYLQLRHWIETPSVLAGLTRKNTLFELTLAGKTTEKGLISDIYKVLLEARIPDKWQYQVKWEEDLGVELDKKKWDMIWRRHAKASVNVKIAECNHKLLLRWHMTPTQLHAINPRLSDNCWRTGCTHKGTFIHMWWYCERAKTFWEKIAKLISEIIGMDFPWDPGIMLLNLPLGLVYPLLAPRGRLITNLLSAAKGLMARFWKYAEQLNREMWLLRVWDIMTLDKITCNLHDNHELFLDTWGPFLDFASENHWADLCPRHMRTMLGMHRE